jgi:GTP cyclohydrolase II
MPPEPDPLTHVCRTRLPLAHCAAMDLDLYLHRRADAREEMALVLSAGSDPVPLVRIHSACLTGDAFGSVRCDCGPQLRHAIDLVAASPGGLLIYLPGDEGRGIGLVEKIRAYALQDAGLDTVEANHALGFPADLRDYAAAVAVLRARGVRRLRLLTNNPHKVCALEEAGIRVEERVPHEVGRGEANRGYLATKKHVLGHLVS